MASEHHRVIRFGVFEADLAAHELHRQGVRLKLQEQPFQVLTALLEKPGEVVAREELRERIWGGDTFVDFDKSLSAAVNKVRQALDDSRTRPRFIETVPKVGYRFIGEISGEVDSPRLDSSAAGWPPVGSRISWGARRIGWLAAAGLSVLALWAFWGFRAQTDSLPPEARMLNPVPLTSYPGEEVHPSFSPDGSQVAFAWNQESGGQFDIYVKLIGPGEPLQLTRGPDDDLSPVWSPDGRWIAYVRTPHSGSSLLRASRWGRVYVVPALGGVERELGEIRLIEFDPGPFMCWSSDGTALIVTDRPSETFGLFAIDLQSGNRRRLTSSPTFDVSPAISPDGRTLAFARGVGGSVEIHALPISQALEPAGQPRQVSFQRRLAVPSLAWTPDGREIVFSAGAYSGRRTLWRIPVSGRSEAAPIVLPTRGAAAPTLARGAARLAYMEESWDSNIWRLNLSPLGELDGSPAELISSTRLEKQPQFSPDGNRIAFGSSRSGNEEIWVCDSDGSNPVQLTSFRGLQVGSPRWSPDGERIVFDAVLSDSLEIYLISSDGGAPTRLTSDSHRDISPSWSHDGRWLYFASDRGGTPQIWKMPTNAASPSASAVQITQNGGNFAPFESKDGEFVYYLRGGDLWRVPRDGGEEVRVLEGVKGGGGYALTGQGIYFLSPASAAGATDLRFRLFGGDETRLISSFQGPVNHLTSSPDGRRILYLQLDRTSADLMLVKDFR